MAASSSLPAMAMASPSETLGNAVIVGGGPSGCLMAHYLLQRGFNVHLFERHLPFPSETEGLYKSGDARSYPMLITSRAIKPLEGAGLQLPPSLLRPLVGSCSHQTNGRQVRMKFADDPSLQGFSVSRNGLSAFLQQSLMQRDSKRISTNFGYDLHGISNDKTKVVFCRNKKYMSETENNHTVEGKTLEIKFDLLVGADGASSKVRSELLRLDQLLPSSDGSKRTAPMTMEFFKNPESYKTIYISPTISKESALFSDGDHAHNWPSLKMLLINMADGSFWGVSRDSNLMNAASASEVQEIFRNGAPEVLDLLLKENPRFSEDFFNQKSISFGGAVKLSRFHVDNIVLIGDAAHAMFPALGTGCNAALEDCLLLNDILSELTTPGQGKLPVNVATSEFTKRRLEDAHAIIDMNRNLSPFARGTLGLAKAFFYIVLHKWFPDLFGPFSYQLLWSDVPFAKIKAKSDLETKIFQVVLVVLVGIIVILLGLTMKRINL